MKSSTTSISNRTDPNGHHSAPRTPKIAHQTTATDDYQGRIRRVVEQAREITKADVGVLYLTSDQMFLEAAYWEGTAKPSAAQLPTYRLPWGQKNDALIEGITAFVAIRGRSLNLNQDEVFNHPAWRGKWDSVYLKGDRNKCKGILAVPVKYKGRLLGELKVENPNESVNQRFSSKHVAALESIADEFGKEIADDLEFWHQHVKARVLGKVPLLVESLERGKSLESNLNQVVTYIANLYGVWFKSREAVHVLWQRNSHRCHLKQFQMLNGDVPNALPGAGKSISTSPNTHDVAHLSDWLTYSIGDQVVQLGVEMDSTTYQILFGPDSCTGESTTVDVIRLRTRTYDFGAIILPVDPVSRASDWLDLLEIDELTGLAMNFVFTLGTFVEHEFGTNPDTYLPDHRQAGLPKTCAIMMTDIRSFSTLTQILRMSGNQKAIVSFVHRYCALIGKSVHQSSIGRVDKYLGDGAIALIGDELPDDVDNAIKVAAAVDCALKIRDGFTQAYLDWEQEEPTSQERVTISDLRKKHNERVDIDCAISINLGEVFFDYFGDGSQTSYTAIGDHMNYTDRLVDAAGRSDEKLGRKRSMILLSQTSYEHLKAVKCLKVCREPIYIPLKGLAVNYPIYELEPSDVDLKVLHEIVKPYTRST